MKKFKKILSAVSATVLCAMPMINGMAVNAASDTERYNTYVLYHQVKSGRVAYFDFTINYESNIIAEPSMKTDLCGTNYFNSIHYTISRKIQTTYSGEVFGYKGIAATTKLLAPLSVQDISEYVSVENIIVKNSRGDVVTLDWVTSDAVLLGDADGDGRVTIEDATLIMQSIVNPDKYKLNEYGKLAADTNLDGRITNLDALCIQEFVAGSINHF